MDNSLQDCYSGRATCLTNDLPGELSHLLARSGQVSAFLAGWLEVGQRLLSSRQMDSDTVDVEEEEYF